MVCSFLTLQNAVPLLAERIELQIFLDNPEDYQDVFFADDKRVITETVDAADKLLFVQCYKVRRHRGGWG